MEPINILHTSDLHLDHVLTDYRKEVRAVRRGELLDTFNFLVDEAIRLNVRLMLISGDLICTRSASDSTVETIRDGFARLGRSSVFVAVTPGEAEEEGGLEMLKNACSADNVHLFLGEEWSSISPFPGITVWGVRTTSRNSTTPVLANLLVEGPGVHVGLMHGTFSGTPGLDSSICPISPEALLGSGLDYLALGHYHSRVNCSVGRATCWYSGSPVHLNFDTRGERHALLVSLREDGTRVETIKVPSRAHRVINIDITGKSTAQIEQRFASMANPDVCLKVELEGHVDLGQSAALAGLERAFQDRFFHLEVTDRTDLSDGVSKKPDGRKRNRNKAVGNTPAVKPRQASAGIPPASGGFASHHGDQDNHMFPCEGLREAEQAFIARVAELWNRASQTSVSRTGPPDESGEGPAVDDVMECEGGVEAEKVKCGVAESDLCSSDRDDGCRCSRAVINRAIALGLSVLGEVFRCDHRETVCCGLEERSDD